MANTKLKGSAEKRSIASRLVGQHERALYCCASAAYSQMGGHNFIPNHYSPSSSRICSIINRTVCNQIMASSTAVAIAKRPSILHMVKAAIASLGGKGGASSQAIKKYLQDNCGVDIEKKARTIRNALNSGVDKCELIRTKGKGAAGTFKLDSTKEKVAAKAAKEKERIKAKKERENNAEQAKKAKLAEKAKKAKIAEKAKKAKIAEKAKKAKPSKKVKKPAPKKTTKKAAKKTPSKPTTSKPTKKPASKNTSGKQKKVPAKPSKK